VKPSVGLPLAAAINMAAFLGPLLIWRWWRGKRLVYWTKATRGVAIAGLGAGALGLVGLAGGRFGGASHPLWIYLIFWAAGVGVPLLISYGLLARWARRNRPEEWTAVTTGELSPSEISPELQRAYLLMGLGFLIPAVVAVLLLLRPDF
jgi:hypothetical protein